MDHGPWSWSEQLELIWSMVMILGFGQKAILDHDRDLGKMVILDHDPGNRFKIHGHDLKLPWVHSCDVFRLIFDYLKNVFLTDNTVFRASRITFFLVNRVEHQKLNQRHLTAPFGWVSGAQLGLRQMQVTNLSLTNNHHLLFSAIGEKKLNKQSQVN